MELARVNAGGLKDWCFSGYCTRCLAILVWLAWCQFTDCVRLQDRPATARKIAWVDLSLLPGH